MRLAVAEHSRLVSLRPTSPSSVLAEWRTTLDLVEPVVAAMDAAVNRAEASIYGAARSLEGLPPRPYPG